MIQDSKFNNSWKFLFSQKQDYQIAREHVFFVAICISHFNIFFTGYQCLSLGQNFPTIYRISVRIPCEVVTWHTEVSFWCPIPPSGPYVCHFIFHCIPMHPTPTSGFFMVYINFVTIHESSFCQLLFLKKNVFFLHCICVQLWLLCCMFCWTCNLSYQIWL